MDLEAITGRVIREEWRVVVAIILAGVALSFAAAVVPHFTSSYRLELLILLPGLVPYLVYGVLSHFLRGRVRVVPGALVLGLQFLLVVQQRWLTDGYATGSLLYWFPLVLAAGLLWLVPEARRRAGYGGEEEG